MKLSELVTRIELRGSLNILNLHLHSEDFYLHFINLLFGWKLENLNVITTNAAGVDLIDSSNRIIVQVSATATRQKIESALTKDLSQYDDYSFKFISISKDAKKLRSPNKPYKNPHELLFSPAEDILDVSVLLKLIKSTTTNIDQLKDIYEFFKKEFIYEPNPDKIESNLATIINILAKENWNQEFSDFETIPYDIEAKITYNQLETARVPIDDYKIHYPRIGKIYSNFDLQGANKSLSILNGIQTMYLDIITSNSKMSPDQVFFVIVKKVVAKIKASINYIPMPDDELDLCAQILVVDAFIRCKIFKNPAK